MPSLGEQMGTRAPDDMLWWFLCMVCIGLVCLYFILLNRCLKCGCDGGCGEHRSNKDTKQEHQSTSTEQVTLTTVGKPPTTEDDYMKLLR